MYSRDSNLQNQANLYDTKFSQFSLGKSTFNGHVVQDKTQTNMLFFIMENMFLNEDIQFIMTLFM
jgi:hypothetical protein